MEKEKDSEEVKSNESDEDFVKNKQELGTVPEHDERIHLLAEIDRLAEELQIPVPRVEAVAQNNFRIGLQDLSENQLKAVLNTLQKKKEKKTEEHEKVERKEVGIEERNDEYIFVFKEIDEHTLKCSGPNGSEHILEIATPICNCIGFATSSKNGKLCIHLEEAKKTGYNVTDLPQVPKLIKDALMRVEKKKSKALKEETVSLSIMDKSIEMPVQTPEDIIQNEDKAVQMIKAIVGDHPKFGDVIEKFSDIEEVSADVVRGLAQYSGIRYMPLFKEVETKKMNLGKIYKATPMSDDKKKAYENLADLMPESDVTIRCKITMVAAWKDKNGGLRVGFGTKEEHLTVYDLKDIVTRGTNFIETMCESKAIKKAILNALPITHDGLLSKIKQTFGWS